MQDLLINTFDKPLGIILTQLILATRFTIYLSLIAFIGGGFRGALHNTLEAAVWNLPVIYGNHKNNRKFIEVDRIEKEGIGFPIKNGNEFKLIKNRILKNRDIGKGGNEFIIKNSGATEKISYHLTKYLK